LKSYVFQVVVEEDQFEDGRQAFHACCPSLPGARTWGHAKEEALKNIREVVQMVVDELVEEGKEIPREGVILEVESPAVDFQRTSGSPRTDALLKEKNPLDPPEAGAKGLTSRRYEARCLRPRR